MLSLRWYSRNIPVSKNVPIPTEIGYSKLGDGITKGRRATANAGGLASAPIPRRKASWSLLGTSCATRLAINIWAESLSTGLTQQTCVAA